MKYNDEAVEKLIDKLTYLRDKALICPPNHIDCGLISCKDCWKQALRESYEVPANG